MCRKLWLNGINHLAFKHMYNNNRYLFSEVWQYGSEAVHLLLFDILNFFTTIIEFKVLIKGLICKFRTPCEPEYFSNGE